MAKQDQLKGPEDDSGETSEHVKESEEIRKRMAEVEMQSGYDAQMQIVNERFLEQSHTLQEKRIEMEKALGMDAHGIVKAAGPYGEKLELDDFDDEVKKAVESFVGERDAMIREADEAVEVLNKKFNKSGDLGDWQTSR